MGMSVDGIMAYGYDLGSVDGWHIQGVEDYCAWVPSWGSEEQRAEIDSGDIDYNHMIERRLQEWTTPVVGVEAVDYGRLDVDGRGLLLAVWSQQALTQPVVSVSLPDLLKRREIERWDDRLAVALQALDIAPIQPHPLFLITALFG